MEGGSLDPLNFFDKKKLIEFFQMIRNGYIINILPPQFKPIHFPCSPKQGPLN